MTVKWAFHSFGVGKWQLCFKYISGSRGEGGSGNNSAEKLWHPRHLGCEHDAETVTSQWRHQWSEIVRKNRTHRSVSRCRHLLTSPRCCSRCFSFPAIGCTTTHATSGQFVTCRCKKTPSHSWSVAMVGGVAQWSERRSLASGLSLTYTPDLRLIYDHFVGKVSAIGQPTRPT